MIINKLRHRKWRQIAAKWAKWDPKLDTQNMENSESTQSTQNTQNLRFKSKPTVALDHRAAFSVQVAPETKSWGAETPKYRPLCEQHFCFKWAPKINTIFILIRTTWASKNCSRGSRVWNRISCASFATKDLILSHENHFICAFDEFQFSHDKVAQYKFAAIDSQSKFGEKFVIKMEQKTVDFVVKKVNLSSLFAFWLTR